MKIVVRINKPELICPNDRQNNESELQYHLKHEMNISLCISAESQGNQIILSIINDEEKAGYNSDKLVLFLNFNQNDQPKKKNTSGVKTSTRN